MLRPLLLPKAAADKKRALPTAGKQQRKGAFFETKKTFFFGHITN